MGGCPVGHERKSALFLPGGDTAESRRPRQSLAGRVRPAWREPGAASISAQNLSQCWYLGPSKSGRGSKGGYHLVTTPRVAPRTSKRSVGWDKLVDLGVTSRKGAFVGVFEVHKPSHDGPRCGSANSREDAWERPELPRRRPPDVLRYAPSTAACPSRTLSSAPPRPSKTPLGG